MKNYFLEKISGINYRMSIHQGDANRRLASEADKILVHLSTNSNDIHDRYIKEFNDLIACIERTLKDLSMPGLTPGRIKGIYNVTAAKYIKLLIDIENDLEFSDK